MAGSIPNALLLVANSGTSFTTGGSTTPSDVALTTTSGNTIVIRASFGDASQYPSAAPTDNKGNTYTPVVTRLAEGSGGAMSIWYCQNITGGSSHTFSGTFNSSVTNGLVFEVIEVAGVVSSSYDSAVLATAIDTTSPFTVTSGTPSQADELILSFYHNGDSGGGTFAESSGMTIIQSTNNAAYWLDASAYVNITSASAYTPSWTYTGASTHNAVAVLGFKLFTGAYTLTCQSGSYSVSGQSAGINYTSNLRGTLGQFDKCMRVEGWF